MTNKAFSDWYDSLPYGEPSYQETFEAGAAHAREVALEEAKLLSDTRAKAWWITHSATNRHMDTTRKAHDDFCGLSVAIEALKKAVK